MIKIGKLPFPSQFKRTPPALGKKVMVKRLRGIPEVKERRYGVGPGDKVGVLYAGPEIGSRKAMYPGRIFGFYYLEIRKTGGVFFCRYLPGGQKDDEILGLGSVVSI
jgi:hypothetical protein